MRGFEYSEGDIRLHCTDKVFMRGEEYFADGLVTRLALRGDSIFAEVEGSDDEPYQLSVQFVDGVPSSASCTCPYEWEGWCKHIVAALLLFLEDPDCAQSEKPLEDVLKPLSRKQLQSLVQALAEEDPSIYDAVMRCLE
jgi:uncharacterized Zn finger protein